LYHTYVSYQLFDKYIAGSYVFTSLDIFTVILIQTDAIICGTDGVTYRNECEMKVAACEKEQYIMVGSRGPCGK